MSKMNTVDEKTREQIHKQLDDFFESAPLSQRSVQPLNHRSINTETYFKASWGQQLKAITAGVSCLLTGISVYCLWLLISGSAGISLLGALLPLAIVLTASLFTVQGYTISGQELVVHRLGWSNTIQLSGLSSATYIPGAMQGSFRTFANGGLFAFAGTFHSSYLGAYRAYATNNMNSVVLKFTDSTTIVVSPDDPEDFVAAVISASK